MSIREFYKGRNVFITGATGFMGKVLLEKLLWSCEDIGNIYILIRPKKGVDPYKRIEQMCQVPAFDRLRSKRPSTLLKIIPICGDMTKLNLGISYEDRKMLLETVSIIFHAASSVRFDDSLKFATSINVKGTREVMELAREMENLKVMVYVSTSYCNCINKTIEEKVLRCNYQWKDIIELTEVIDDHILNILEPKIIDKRPNTYTFTKCLAENVVMDYSSEVPCIIIRPSIVVSSYDEPLPGWIDSLNGPIGMFAGCLTGIIHFCYGNEKISGDYIPCDFASNGIIVASWYKGTSSSRKCFVVNGAAGCKNSVGQADMVNYSHQAVIDSPISLMLWYPSVIITNNKFILYLGYLLTHISPGLLIDLILKLNSNVKLRLMTLYRKVFRTSIALHYFTSNEWNILTNHYESMSDNLFPIEKEIFRYDTNEVDFSILMKHVVWGIKKFIFNDQESNLKNHQRKARVLKWIHYSCKYALIFFVFWKIAKSILIYTETFNFGNVY